MKRQSFFGDTKLGRSILPERAFAKDLWEVLPTWRDWNDMFGTRCIETDKDIPLVDALVLSGLATSKAEARRLIKSNGISVWFEKETDCDLILHKSAQETEDITLIQRGKHGRRMTVHTCIIHWL